MKLKYLFMLLYIVNRTGSFYFQATSEVRRMNFTQLGVKYGHSVEEHEVMTEDGYILQLFRIPRRTAKPVLLMHGLMDSADTFILRGKKSLVITLAKAGYDVWAGNMRGNKYSRRHLSLNPDTDMEFWDYSFHEGGFYDLPATIDYILRTTGQQSLRTIGHSQGATMHFVLLSKRPEYNEKIKLFVALAPAVFVGNVISPVKDIAPFAQRLRDIFKSFGVHEAFPEKSSFTSRFRAVCRQDIFGSEICYSRLFAPLLGHDAKRLESSFLRTAIEHAPCSTSIKSFIHYGQLAVSKRFCHYDYGTAENLKRYGYPVPPDYNLREVNTKIAIMVAKNDPLSRIKDVAILRSLLPNVVYYHLMKQKKWNHIDFIWANDMTVSLFPRILELLNENK